MSSSNATGSSVRICDFPPESNQILPPIQGFEKMPLVSLEKSVESLKSIVPQLDHMVWTVMESCHEPKDMLTKDESASIMLYTLEWAPKETSFYYILNSTLRSQNRRELIPWFLYLRLFIFALSKLPSIVPRVIYRGVEKDMREEFPVGKKFIWWSFTSCTSSLDVLNSYLGKTGNRTVFNIICDSAKNISQHSSYASENEFLLYPARQFQVISSFDGGNGLHIIQVEEIQPPFHLIPIPKADSPTPTIVFCSTNSNPAASPPNSSYTSCILPGNRYNSDERSLPVTNRTAIDSSGCIGSLYDAYKDLIFGPINFSMKGKRCQEFKSKKCMIINGNRYQKENILKAIGVENELRLSLSLNLRGKTGLAEILNYSNPINEYTRFFYYSYLNREEKVADNPIKISYSDKPTKPPTVLQLTSDAQRIVEIDNVLQRLRTFLLNDDKIPNLTQQEENLLTNSIHTKIYSNTHDLRDINRLYDVCRLLKQAQNKTINYIVSYILRPIKWLYPLYTGTDVEFISLPEHLNNNIEEYVLQLRDDILKLEKSIKEGLLKLLNGYLKDRLSNMQQQWFVVNKMCTNEIDRLSKLVIDVRSGRTSVSIVEQTLESDQKMQLQHMIHDLKQNIKDLQQKGNFISDLDRLKFQYLNVVDYGIDSVDNERTIERKLVPNYEADCVLCSNDSLNETNPSQLDHLWHGMIEELKYNPNIRLLYADFSYCSFELPYMIKLPSDKYSQQNNKYQLTPKPRSSMELSTNTSPRTKLFSDTNKTLVQPSKLQTSTTMPTEARAYQLKPSKSENSYQASTKLSTDNSLSNTTQASLLSQNKPYTSSPQPVQTQTN
ncbi:unnamed protein product [Rotaria socialis]|uniref:NAD(P)(+)--arginine ADP-ribosyltransferase n=1 Tax=Rotaria socialis TaxID=392032 RepID=A0A821PNF1_9BILA|nr:unnamed protein product [Rotaria socialis]CAF4806754.1 unnamed protein product [Rotaria socialis]